MKSFFFICLFIMIASFCFPVSIILDAPCGWVFVWDHQKEYWEAGECFPGRQIKINTGSYVFAYEEVMPTNNIPGRSAKYKIVLVEKDMQIIKIGRIEKN